MNIPDALLNKTTRYVLSGDVTPRLLEEGIKYLGSFFDSEEKYFDFLLKLDKDRYDDFLYTIFFYWAHDLYRIPKEDRIRNIDGFMYQVTLSIIEHLDRSLKKGPKAKIKTFFNKFFTQTAKLKLNKVIKAKSLGEKPINLEFWEVLYDMRNEFIHDASWFNLLEDGGGFASISGRKHRSHKGKNGKWVYIEYMCDIRIKFKDYLHYFWEAYINHFKTPN